MIWHVYVHGCMQIYVFKHKHLHRCECFIESLKYYYYIAKKYINICLIFWLTATFQNGIGQQGVSPFGLVFA